MADPEPLMADPQARESHADATDPSADEPGRPSRGRRGLGFGALALLAVVAAAVLVPGALPPEVTPLKGPKLSHLGHCLGSYRERMLWGTYSSGLYFGLRTREPKGLQAGLMWFNPDAAEPLQEIRHQAQERDGLQKFGWESHDGEAYGRQELHDGSRHLTTHFVKRFCAGCLGGDWAARISVQAEGADGRGEGQQGEEELRSSLVFYIADLQGAGVEGVSNVDAEVEGEGYLLAHGDAQPFGGWKLHARPSKGGRLPKLHYLGLHTPHLHNLSQAVSTEIARPTRLVAGRSSRGAGMGSPRIHLPDEVDHASNVALFQFTGALPFSMDFVFTASLSRSQQVSQGPTAWVKRAVSWTGWFGQTSASPEWHRSEVAAESLESRIASLSGGQLDRLLQDGESAFHDNFRAKFGDLGSRDLPKGTEAAAKAGLSNMLGGIAYFHGTSDVRLKDRVAQSWPASLLTAVPSRSFFPRGFLWDEGFHQLLIRRWNRRLSRDILAHWLDLVNSQGWIAREQILGEEARSRVPAEFVVQDPTAANPPTLFLALADMARLVASKTPPGSPADPERQEELDFLRAAFPRMQAWLDWLIRTQRGVADGSWRWRGRHVDVLPDPLTGGPSPFTRELNPKTLTSGLDDYPRASHPSDQERHLDLYCWMALATSSMASIAASLGLQGAQVAAYGKLAAQLSDLRHLNRMHYDPRAGQYRDWGNHTEDVRLDWRYADIPMRLPGGQATTHRQRIDMVRFVGQPPRPSFVPHFGYVSLFPLIMRLLPPKSPELAAQLHHLRTGGVLTPFGLASLSSASSLHMQRNTEHDPPYWRGPVWLNVNFLVLASLDHYAKVDGPQAVAARKLHDTLRASLLQLVAGQYEESGYLWENYDQATGKGRGCRPFSGWTALVALIAGESYFEL